MKSHLCFVCFCAMAACAPPKLATPIAEISALPSLDKVMDNQATAADPLFAKTGGPYSDEDYAAMAAAGERIQATSTKIKDFSKGPEFNALADQLNGHAKELQAAGTAKDQAAATKALTEMKSTCKTCHSKFR
jgi:hypothetical protein